MNAYWKGKIKLSVSTEDIVFYFEKYKEATKRTPGTNQ